MKAFVLILAGCMVCGGWTLASGGPAESMPQGNPAMVTINAVDEAGTPLADVRVEAEFLYGTKFRNVTDANGLFVLKGVSGGWDTWYALRKEGYYQNHGKYMLSNIVNGRWEPWNPILTEVMMRIENPIPMYAKKVETKIPVQNTALGFDLEKGDWVSPYGTGQVSDFIFTLSNRISSITDYNAALLLSFRNEFDGVVSNTVYFANSAFHLPRYAPQQGYLKNWMAQIEQKPGNKRCGNIDVFGGGNPHKNYFFRVRSKTNFLGQLTESNYGKICGEIEASGIAGPIAGIRFTYYLNPTPNDRNMEFDMKQNLIPHLKSTEEPTEP